jgi:hypothetical protein
VEASNEIYRHKNSDFHCTKRYTASEPCDLMGWITANIGGIYDLRSDIEEDFGLYGGNFEGTGWEIPVSLLSEKLAAIWGCLNQLQFAVNYGGSAYYGYCG